MLRTGLLIGLGWCLLNAATVRAQDALVWKFEKGQTFYVEETTEVQQTVTALGQSQKQNSTQINVTQYDVQDVKEDGSVDLQMTFVTVGGQGAGGATEIFERIQGTKFLVTLDAERKITKFEGYEDFVKRVSGGDENLARTFRQILSPESFQTSVNQLFTLLPNKEVAQGDTWTQELKVALGPLGGVTVTRTLTDAGRETVEGQEYVKIAIAGDAKYEAPKNGTGGDLSFKISKADIKFSDLSGTAHYDPQAARLSPDSRMKLNGTMTIQIGTNEQEVKLEQDQTIRVRVLSEKPAAAPEK